MKLKFRYTERFVGTFILVASLLILSTLTFILLNKRYFEQKAFYRAKLADANGLGPSSPIYFKGFKIGVVSEYHLTADNHIEAILEIYDEYTNRIVVNSALWKGLNPVTNASAIEFLPGLNSTIPLLEGSIIPAIDVPEGRLLLEKHLVAKAGDPLSTLLENMQTFTENLTADTIKNNSAIFRAINNFVDISEDAKNITSNLDIMTSALLKDRNSQQGTLFRVLNNTADLTEEAKQITGMVKQTILKADSLITAFQRPDSLGLKLMDPTGEIFVHPIKNMIAKFNEMLPKIDNLIGYMNSRTSDMTVMMEDLKITLRQAQTTFETINQMTAGTSGIPVNQNNASSQRLKYKSK